MGGGWGRYWREWGRGRGEESTYTLLQHAANNTPRRRGTVLKRRGGRVAVDAAHGDAEEGAARQELGVRVAEAGALFPRALAPVLPTSGPGFAAPAGGVRDGAGLARGGVAKTGESLACDDVRPGPGIACKRKQTNKDKYKKIKISRISRKANNTETGIENSPARAR